MHILVNLVLLSAWQVASYLSFSCFGYCCLFKDRGTKEWEPHTKIRKLEAKGMEAKEAPAAQINPERKANTEKAGAKLKQENEEGGKAANRSQRRSRDKSQNRDTKGIAATKEKQ